MIFPLADTFSIVDAVTLTIQLSATNCFIQKIVQSNHSCRTIQIQFYKMETILGIKGEDFVMVAADCTQAHSIISLKEGKIVLSIKISLFYQFIHLNLTKIS